MCIEGVALNVNAVVEPSPVNVSVELTVGLLTLFCIVNAVNLFTSMTGDNYQMWIPLIVFNNIDLLLVVDDNSFV